MARSGSGARRPIEERRFHAWLARAFARPEVGRLPLGDDTAAIDLGNGRVALLTTDALTLGTHFTERSAPRDIGAAVAAVSLSDLAAKGGRPRAFLLDLLVPPGTQESWCREVLLGAEAMLAQYGAHLVGGDTKPARTPAVVGTLFGLGRADRLAPRSGARAGDLVVVTGAVGRGGYAAMAIRRGRRPTRRELHLLLQVRPRVREGAALARFAHAMMDTSDGLAESSRLLAAASGTRVVLEEDRLPLYPPLAARRLARAPRLAAAFYGGDYELLATISPRDLRRARTALGAAPLSVVGRVERGRGAWLASEGRVVPMPRAGWRPFGPPDRRAT